MHTHPKVALVLGAQGGIGNEVTRALLRHGWQVRALARKPQAGFGHPQLEWIIGDAMRRQDVVDASYGSSVIVHAVNPAKYHNWRGLTLPMLDNTIAAATITGARILMPGTIYNYGPDAFPLIDEHSPQNPHTRKGAVRVEMEERLRDAAWDGRCRSLIVRAGDFFGPRAGSSWFSQGLVMRGQPVRFVLNPGHKDLHHSWAYLPDVAETMVRLLAQESTLEKLDTFHFRGHWLRNCDMLQTICDVAGISRSRVVPFPWWSIRATAPFAELSDEMQEMRYLWQEPIKLNNAKLRARIGFEPHTPIEEALRSTLVGIGCLRESRVVPTPADIAP
jgi:nucleoside-diphosphate-sugar epimerase